MSKQFPVLKPSPTLRITMKNLVEIFLYEDAKNKGLKMKFMQWLSISKIPVEFRYGDPYRVIVSIDPDDEVRVRIWLEHNAKV